MILNGSTSSQNISRWLRFKKKIKVLETASANSDQQLIAWSYKTNPSRLVPINWAITKENWEMLEKRPITQKKKPLKTLKTSCKHDHITTYGRK